MAKDQNKDKKEKSVKLREEVTENKVKKSGKEKKSTRKSVAVQGGRPVGRKHLKGDAGDVLRNVHATTKADEVK